MDGDLFIKAPDRRFGHRDAHLPPAIGMDPSVALHSVVPIAPSAFRGSSATLAFPIPSLVPVASQTTRRNAAIRSARKAIQDRTTIIGARGRITVGRFRTSIEPIRERITRGKITS